MDDDAKRKWVDNDIPHRVRACLALTEQQNVLLQSMPFDRATRERIARRCETDCIWEGQRVAMRWLIEFVGVSADKSGRRKRPTPYASHDAGIEHIVPSAAIDLNSQEAITLARVWQGCTQASTHPTHESGHPSVNEKEMNEALTIVMTHLDATIYGGRRNGAADAALQPAN